MSVVAVVEERNEMVIYIPTGGPTPPTPEHVAGVNPGTQSKAGAKGDRCSYVGLSLLIWIHV
jgi:hypothetical protein